MKSYLIAERYAKALSGIVDDAELDATVDALLELTRLYEGSDALRNVLSSPAIDLDKRCALLREVTGVTETDGRVVRLVEALLRRGRITMLADVSKVFCSQADARLNRVRAVVVTAAATTDDQEAHLVKALSAWAGKDVCMTREVDPDILGGVVARVAGTVIDGSIRTRIERMREELLAHEIRV